MTFDYDTQSIGASRYEKATFRLGSLPAFFQDVSAPSATQGFAPGTRGCLAVELSTTLVDTKQFGIEFNSNLKTGTKTGGRSL